MPPLHFSNYDDYCETVYDVQIFLYFDGRARKKVLEPLHWKTKQGHIMPNNIMASSFTHYS
jgi:hypothetical protein